MKIFGMSDLHLAISTENKNMDLFGLSWENYMERIAENWRGQVAAEDVVILPGDTSWAMKIDDAYKDFKYIDQLPGSKIILKGNHDYWWTTGNKMNNYIKMYNLNSISFIQSSFYYIEEPGIAVCGSRGWKNPWDNNFSNEDRKIYDRELIRLELSLSMGEKHGSKEIIAALHYPPFLPDDPKEEDNKILDLLVKYGVKTCIFGHVHYGSGKDKEKWQKYIRTPFNIKGINFYLVSSDMNSFMPVRIF